jgi:hypothetical protein
MQKGKRKKHALLPVGRSLRGPIRVTRASVSVLSVAVCWQDGERAPMIAAGSSARERTIAFQKWMRSPQVDTHVSPLNAR